MSFCLKETKRGIRKKSAAASMAAWRVGSENVRISVHANFHTEPPFQFCMRDQSRGWSIYRFLYTRGGSRALRQFGSGIQVGWSRFEDRAQLHAVAVRGAEICGCTLTFFSFPREEVGFPYNKPSIVWHQTKCKMSENSHQLSATCIQTITSCIFFYPVITGKLKKRNLPLHLTLCASLLKSPSSPSLGLQLQSISLKIFPSK